MALTATATPRVQHDVVQQLCLPECVVFRSSMNRSNLRSALAFVKIFNITRVACTLGAVQQRPNLAMVHTTPLWAIQPGVQELSLLPNCFFEQIKHMHETDSSAEQGTPSTPGVSCFL